MPATEKTAAKKGARQLVLVADDEEDIVALVVLRLQKRGFDAITAHDGQRALDLALEHRPAIAILDVLMPKLDGYQVTERLRASDATADMPIILASASVHQVDADRGFDAGANAFLRKPFAPADLFAHMDRLLA